MPYLTCQCGYLSSSKSDYYRHVNAGCNERPDRRRRTQLGVQEPAGEDADPQAYAPSTSSGVGADTLAEGRETGVPDAVDLTEQLYEQIMQHAEQLGLEANEQHIRQVLNMLQEQPEECCDDEPLDEEAEQQWEWLRDALGAALEPQAAAAEQQQQQQHNSESDMLRNNLLAPLYEGAALTVLQSCFLALSQKRAGLQKDSMFDQQCRTQKEVLLPAGNLYPGSLYLMKRVLSCKQVEDVQQHVCVNDCLRFPHLPRLLYRQHMEDCCSCCGEKRFEVRETSGGRKAVPRKVYYDFGLDNVVRDKLFTDPDWCKYRGQGRHVADDYYCSDEARRLHEAAGASLQDQDTSVYELGLDWAQMFKSKVHSTGFLTIRCCDLSAGQRMKRRFSHIVAIIPGPVEPKRLEPYLGNTLELFRRHGPGGEGLLVTEHLEAVGAGDLQCRQFAHTILLGGVYGDTPGVKKLAKWLSHSAYLGCGYCLLRGTHSRGMYFLGYAAPTHAGAFAGNEVSELGAHSERGTGTAAYCGDASAALTHAQQVARALLVDDRVAGVQAGTVKASDVGSNGLSPFVAELSYVDYNNLFLVPVAHAGLCGVVKDFWYHVLSAPARGQAREWYMLSSTAKNMVASREQHMVATCDFGRKYTDIISKKGNWTMEDWFHWTETWSVYALMPTAAECVLPPMVRQMWGLLRKGLLYFCRLHAAPDVAQDTEAAVAALKGYAVLVEQEFGVRMCKFNLHLLLCRLAEQEKQRGKVAYSTEYWVENLIQWAKSVVKGRTTLYPELVLVNDMLIDDALDRARAAYADHVKSFDEWVPAYRSLEVRGSNLDAGNAEGNQLLGSGRELTQSELGLVVPAIHRRIDELCPPGWDHADVASATMQLYTYADIQGRELLHSTSYLRPKTRVSYNALVSYEEAGGGEIMYVGKVRFFVKVAAGGREPLRVGMADLCRVQLVAGATGRLWRAARYAVPDHMGYPVLLHEFKQKHVLVQASQASQEAWFIPYGNMSGQGRSV